jgi:hypothetical protein
MRFIDLVILMPADDLDKKQPQPWSTVQWLYDHSPIGEASPLGVKMRLSSYEVSSG